LFTKYCDRKPRRICRRKQSYFIEPNICTDRERAKRCPISRIFGVLIEWGFLRIFGHNGYVSVHFVVDIAMEQGLPYATMKQELM